MDGPRTRLTGRLPVPLPLVAAAALALPGSLHEAVALAERSELLRRALGDHTYHSLLQNKRIEWDRYRAAVTDYELNRYLPVL